MSGCLCFGAGVLLATLFLHLLPEAHEDMENAMKKGFLAQTSFPVAEAIICCGFFLFYMVEEITHHFIQGEHGCPNTDSNKSTNNAKEEDNNAGECKGNSHIVGFSASCSSCIVDAIEDHRPEGKIEEESTSVLKAITITVALSFHSVMEGLAIGLQETSLDLWLLVGVVCAHKLVVAFSLGMELLQEGLKRAPFLAAMITFSLSTPIGGVIGAIIISVSDGESAAGVIVPIILNGLAGGCILFCTFCEILERERSRPYGSLVRIMSAMAGFLVMCGLESILLMIKKGDCNLAV